MSAPDEAAAIVVMDGDNAIYCDACNSTPRRAPRLWIVDPVKTPHCDCKKKRTQATSLGSRH